MSKSMLLLLVICLNSFSCNKHPSQPNVKEHYGALPKNQFTYNQLISVFQDYIIRAEAHKATPDRDGALNRNKDGYFYIIFQRELIALANYAIVYRDTIALSNMIKAIEYSFQYQKESGDFEIMVPSELEATAGPSRGDIVGGVSFFLCSLGSSLLAMSQSAWYQESQETKIFRNRIAVFEPSFIKALEYLLSEQDFLKSYDREYANRMFFHALAFYTMGEYLDHEVALETSDYFIHAALQLQSEEGYFIEEGGYDTSYNGVSLYQAFILYCFLDQASTRKSALWRAISSGINWQASKIIPTGEISTEGNTRVFPGGEGFLGMEKAVDWSNTEKAFLSMYYFTEIEKYHELAMLVENYYR